MAWSGSAHARLTAMGTIFPHGMHACPNPGDYNAPCPSLGWRQRLFVTLCSVEGGAKRWLCPRPTLVSVWFFVLDLVCLCPACLFRLPEPASSSPFPVCCHEVCPLFPTVTCKQR